MPITLGELAKVVRSKNAKPYRLTFDVIFDDKTKYDRVVSQKVLTKQSVAALYGIPEDQIVSFLEFPAGLAIKFTFRRPRTQCTLGETDVYGCQQHAPLLDVIVN